MEPVAWFSPSVGLLCATIASQPGIPPRQRKHESAECRTIYHNLYSIFMTSTVVLPSCEILKKKRGLTPFLLCHVAPHFNLKHNNLIYLTFYPGSKASYQWVGSSNPVWDTLATAWPSLVSHHFYIELHIKTDILNLNAVQSTQLLHFHPGIALYAHTTQNS